jgi:hypothetical protein
VTTIPAIPRDLTNDTLARSDNQAKITPPYQPEHPRNNLRKLKPDPANNTDITWLQPPAPQALHVPNNIDGEHQNEAAVHPLTKESCLNNNYIPPESFCVKSKLDPASKKEKDSFDATPVHGDERLQAHEVITCCPHYDETPKLQPGDQDPNSATTLPASSHQVGGQDLANSPKQENSVFFKKKISVEEKTDEPGPNNDANSDEYPAATPGEFNDPGGGLANHNINKDVEDSKQASPPMRKSVE